MWQDILKTINITAGKTKTVGMPIIEEDDSCKEKFMELRKAIEAYNNVFYILYFHGGGLAEEEYCALLELFNLFVKKSDVMYNDWKDIKVHSGSVKFGFSYTTTFHRGLEEFQLKVFDSETGEEFIIIEWDEKYTSDFIDLLKRYL